MPRELPAPLKNGGNAIEHDGNGRELQRTANGTTFTTVSINPGAGSSNPANLTAAGTDLFYTADDGTNGVELYRDRPEDEWPRGTDGGIQMHTRPLDLAGLLAGD